MDFLLQRNAERLFGWFGSLHCQASCQEDLYTWEAAWVIIRTSCLLIPQLQSVPLWPRISFAWTERERGEGGCCWRWTWSPFGAFSHKEDAKTLRLRNKKQIPPSKSRFQHFNTQNAKMHIPVWNLFISTKQSVELRIVFFAEWSTIGSWNGIDHRPGLAYKTKLTTTPLTIELNWGFSCVNCLLESLASCRCAVCLSSCGLCLRNVSSFTAWRVDVVTSESALCVENFVSGQREISTKLPLCSFWYWYFWWWWEKTALSQCCTFSEYKWPSSRGRRVRKSRRKPRDFTASWVVIISLRAFSLSVLQSADNAASRMGLICFIPLSGRVHWAAH